MPCSIILILSLVPATALIAAPNPADNRLSVAQIESDVALAKEAYTRVHPGYDRYTSATELEMAWQAVVDRARAENGLSLGDFYLEIESVLTEIRCDHTKAELPGSLRQYRETHAVYLPFRWEVIEGRGFITAVNANSRLHVGDEVLAIDDQHLSYLLSEVAPYIPVDGYTEWAKRGGLSQSLEFMGGAVDHFGSLLWPVRDTATLRLRNRAGEIREESVVRLNYSAYQSIGTSRDNVRNFKGAVTFERLGANAAYLRIDTFVNYREPVDPDTLYRPIFESLHEEGRDQLILDLRKNGGGSIDAERRLLAYLISEPLKATTEMRVATLNLDGLREHLSTWEKRALNPNRLAFRKNRDDSYSLRSWFAEELRTLRPAKFSFGGEIVVLTSDENSSASTNLISILKTHGRVTTVGEKTGGSPDGPTAGIIFTLTLPESDIRTRIPGIRTYNNSAGFDTGNGITPDQLVPRTVEAFLQGRDEALERAKALTVR